MREALIQQIDETFGVDSPEGRLARLVKKGHSYLPIEVAMELGIELSQALSTLLHISTHRFPVLELQVSNGGVAVPLESARAYLEDRSDIDENVTFAFIAKESNA